MDKDNTVDKEGWGGAEKKSNSGESFNGFNFNLPKVHCPPAYHVLTLVVCYVVVDWAQCNAVAADNDKPSGHAGTVPLRRLFFMGSRCVDGIDFGCEQTTTQAIANLVSCNKFPA